jgi:hypothetical protein
MPGGGLLIPPSLLCVTHWSVMPSVAGEQDRARKAVTRDSTCISQQKGIATVLVLYQHWHAVDEA